MNFGIAAICGCIFITILLHASCTISSSKDALLGVHFDLTGITVAYFDDTRVVVAARIPASKQYFDLIDGQFDFDTTDWTARKIKDPVSAQVILLSILEDARRRAQNHAGRQLKVGAVTFAFGASEDFRDVLIDAVVKFEPDLSDLHRVYDSRVAIPMVFPESDCFLDTRLLRNVNDDPVYSVLSIDVTPRGTIVNIASMTEEGPFISQEAQERVKGTGHKLEVALQSVFERATTTISSVVLSGSVSQNILAQLQVVLAKIDPGLPKLVKIPRYAYEDVRVVGAACWALELAVNGRYHGHLPLASEPRHDEI